ncbi:DUF4232 domain-containing protein [Streptomyces sp. CAI-85]|uniref:DUF4232 domain-containing protein n=1 Tax=Streptomyces sp. CAI-85 TaxID=1472662 RepID=UPI001587C38F|nr:DUF4232 domain-containing protein [Streptomyces sp. CAI-85]NUV58175.1 DUF4232 domain-containing protein [Streptomyces sp. CAI-85]
MRTDACDNRTTPRKTKDPRTNGGWRSYAVTAAAFAAAFAATACEPDTADGAGSTPSGRPSASSPAKPSDSGGDNSGGTTGGGGNGGDSAAVPDCAEEDLSFGTTLEDGKGEVPKHLLIAVTNAGDKKCAVHHYPYLFLGDYAEARYPIDVYEDSDPGEGPVVLAPGDEAYAALLASGVPMDQYETDSVTLLLHGREHGGDGSGPIGVDLPRVVAFDDGARVTYWTTASGYALDFIMDS